MYLASSEIYPFSERLCSCLTIFLNCRTLHLLIYSLSSLPSYRLSVCVCCLIDCRRVCLIIHPTSHRTFASWRACSLGRQLQASSNTVCLFVISVTTSVPVFVWSLCLCQCTSVRVGACVCVCARAAVLCR